MQRKFVTSSLAAALCFALAACGSSAGDESADVPTSEAPTTQAAPEGERAVVIMSGVLSVSPFTTPDAACTTGWSAGNTDAFLRDSLTDAGFDVFTVPAQPGGGVVQETDSTELGPFGGCPEQLPASMTVDTTAVLTDGGEKIRNFVQHLHDEYGITEIDLIGHSLGGPLSRTAIGVMKAAGTPVRVRSLTTVGSPWESPFIARPTDPADPLSACDGLEICQGFVSALYAQAPVITPLMDTLSVGYEDWAASLAGTLDDIPVTLIGGTYFTKDGGDPDKWPNDGVIQRTASLALNVPDDYLPQRTCHEFPNTHSLFLSSAISASEETALTWNPEVAKVIIDALSATEPPADRTGCPAS